MEMVIKVIMILFLWKANNSSLPTCEPDISCIFPLNSSQQPNLVDIISILQIGLLRLSLEA